MGGTWAKGMCLAQVPTQAATPQEWGVVLGTVLFPCYLHTGLPGPHQSLRTSRTAAGEVSSKSPGEGWEGWAGARVRCFPPPLQPAR